MATRVRKAFRKNLFGIVTMVISAAVLLGFLFSSEGLQSLNQISGNIRFLWLLGRVSRGCLCLGARGFGTASVL